MRPRIGRDFGGEREETRPYVSTRCPSFDGRITVAVLILILVHVGDPFYCVCLSSFGSLITFAFNRFFLLSTFLDFDSSTRMRMMMTRPHRVIQYTGEVCRDMPTFTTEVNLNMSELFTSRDGLDRTGDPLVLDRV